MAATKIAGETNMNAKEQIEAQYKVMIGGSRTTAWNVCKIAKFLAEVMVKREGIGPGNAKFAIALRQGRIVCMWATEVRRVNPKQRFKEGVPQPIPRGEYVVLINVWYPERGYTHKKYESMALRYAGEALDGEYADEVYEAMLATQAGQEVEVTT